MKEKKSFTVEEIQQMDISNWGGKVLVLNTSKIKEGDTITLHSPCILELVKNEEDPTSLGKILTFKVTK